MLFRSKKYLRPYGTADIAKLSFNNFTCSLNNVISSADTCANNAFNMVVRHQSFANEMQAILNSGYVFVDPAFRLVVEAMLEQRATKREKLDAAYHAYSIKVRMHFDEQVCDVVRMFDVRNRYAHEIKDATTCKITELDPELSHKLAALSMLDEKRFVEGLGYKVNDSSYWVLA